MERVEMLQHFKNIPVLGGQGFVRLVDLLGDDGSIVTAARVTTGKGRSVHEWSDGVCKVCRMPKALPAMPDRGDEDDSPCREGDRRLIRYMMAHRHETPFEFCEMVLHIRMPMDAWRQGVRHRVFSINEYSTRFKEAIDEALTTPSDAWRAQSGANRQGSAGVVTEWPEGHRLQEGESLYPHLVRDDGDTLRVFSSGSTPPPSPGEHLSVREAQLHAFAREVYEERLAFGVAKEQARKDLPLSNFTEFYWKGDLRGWLHFLGLRLDPHAQLEIRAYAEAIWQIVQAWVPMAAEAFRDYRLEAVTFSRQEVAAVRTMASGWARDEQAECESRGVEGPTEHDHVLGLVEGLGKREQGDFLKKLGVKT